LLRQGLASAEPGSQSERSTGPYAPFAAPTPAELASHFPQFEILELVGQGGMGAVYRARQAKLERLVALKILPPAAGRDLSFAERFTREARALARLNHPNIVGVYDFGQADGLYYFLMEFVEGANLRHVLREGHLQPRQALRIVPQLCDALQYAHDEGIVHRDIKPENVLLDKKGRIKIADFGLAKLLGHAAEDYALTGSHQVMGTPHYMAPEQMEKPLTVDHRADIYSLGVVFYEMLTGELPLGRFAPPSQKVDIDVRLDDVVLRALAKEPERRYQHASDVKTELESIAKMPGAAGPAPAMVSAMVLAMDEAVRCRTRGVASGLLVAGLVLLLASLAGVAWSGWTLARVLSVPADQESTTHGGSIINLGGAGSSKVHYSVNAPRLPVLWLILVEQLLAVGAGTTVILAAFAINKREFLGLSRAGSILATVPLSPAWLVTFPLGLWAILVLRKPEVRTAFDAPLRAPAPSGSHTEVAPLWQPPSLRTFAGWNLLLCLLGALITFLPWYRMNIFGFAQTMAGFDSWHGLVSGGAFAVGLVLLVVCELRNVSAWFRALLTTTAGGIGTAIMVLDLWEATHPTFTTSASGDTQIFGDLAKSLTEMMMESIRATPLFGAYLALASGLATMLVGLLQLWRGTRARIAAQ
jgi:predicted Ser/Thr protein kinase